MEVEDGSRFLLVVWGVRASEDCNVGAQILWLDAIKLDTDLTLKFCIFTFQKIRKKILGIDSDKIYMCEKFKL